MASNTLWKAFRTLSYNKCICFNLFAPRQTLQVSPKWVSLSANRYSDIVLEDPAPEQKSKRKIFIPKITLLAENNDMEVTTLEEAERIAKRRDLKLVRVVDVDIRSERPVYRLMKMQDYMEEDAQYKSEAKENRDRALKEDKTIAITAKIADHDLSVKAKSIQKMLKKRHGVRVIITCDGNLEKAKAIRDHLTESSKEIAKAVTQKESAHNIKLVLRPILDKINQEIKKNEISMKDEH